jgi:hypothetical protein
MFAATGHYHCTTTMETTTTGTIVPVDLDRRASVVDIVEVQPQRHDVIFGRGKRYQYHFGNLYFEGKFAYMCVNTRESTTRVLVLSVVVAKTPTVNGSCFWCVCAHRTFCFSLTRTGCMARRIVATELPLVP